MTRLTYRQIQAIDNKDWPKWVIPGFIALVLVGAGFEWSHESPVVAVVGIAVILAIMLPIRQRQLRRRMAECQVRQAEAAGNAAPEVDKGASAS